VRTLRVGDEVLALRYSRHTDPQKLLLAVALLDATVKVFFEDTLKFFLSLYGHKLPVLAMDVSADGTLLVTASSDKNVKLWGLDFGVRLGGGGSSARARKGGAFPPTNFTTTHPPIRRTATRASLRTRTR
jgi:WD40 repeat protein